MFGFATKPMSEQACTAYTGYWFLCRVTRLFSFFFFRSVPTNGKKVESQLSEGQFIKSFPHCFTNQKTTASPSYQSTHKTGAGQVSGQSSCR